jgi:hypothetical protein
MLRQIIGAIGVIFVVVGVLGFFSDQYLLGIFEVNTIHNLVHIASGVVALIAAASSERVSRIYAQVFGVVYLAVFVLGLVLGGDLLGLFRVNAADNVLHAVGGLAHVGSGGPAGCPH